VFQCYDPIAFLQEYSLNTDAAGTAPPDAFGPFRVLHQIGAGALGPVFRAYQPEQDRLVAVKLFRLDLPPERAYQLVAELERLIAADLTHAGIAAPLATGISDVSAYLAMDFVAADSLDIVIRDQQRTTPSDVVRVASQLANALDLAAAIDIMHGALHPRDVLLSDDEVRVTGIGIARALEEVGSAAPIRRPYTAPERAAGGPWDRRADVFSLAALVFELLTRRRVSGPGDQSFDAFAGLAGASAEALDRVFDRALAEQPGDRFATAGDFARALQAAVERKRSVSGRVGPSVRPPVAEPVVESPPSEELPLEELPLLTDSMLGEAPEWPPASDAPPPPIADPSHDALASNFAFRDAPFSMIESLHEPDGRSNAQGHLIDDFQSTAHDATSHRLPIDAFSEAVDETPPPPQSRWFPANERSVGSAPDLALKQYPPEYDVEGPLAVPVVDTSSPSGPFESVDTGSRSSSGVWPLMLALVVGIALGFGMAMLLLGRDRVPPAPQQAAVQAGGGRAAAEVRDEPIREVTEQTVATPPKPTAPEPAATAKPEPPRPAVNSPVPAAPASTTVRPSAATPIVAAPSKPAVAKVTPPPSKATVASPKLASSATSPTASAAKASVAPARGASKAAAATPVKPTVQTPAKPEPGSLAVDSRPPGAGVYVDGRRVGTTPLVVQTINVGEYTIGLDLDGYQRWATTVKVTSGERSRVAASLER
jgi:serine/threonine protein kinase